MSRTYVIRPEDPAGTLRRLGLPAVLDGTANAAPRIDYIEVCPDRQQCRLVVEFVRLSPEPMNLDLVKQQLAASLDGVGFAVQLEVHQVEANQKVINVWRQLVDELAGRHPLLRTWLPSVRLEFDSFQDNRTVKVVVPAGIARDILAERGVLRHARNEFRTALGVPVEVEVVVEDSTAHAADVLAPEEAEAIHQIVEQRKRRQESQDLAAQVLYGRLPENAQAERVGAMVEEHQRVVADVMVLSCERRTLNSGKELFSFDVTDFSDSITTKVFAEPDEVPLLERVREGTWVRIAGRLRYDAYQRELVVMADGVSSIAGRRRTDTAETKRVELHLHTQMSAMDSVAQLSDLFARAATWGHEALAVTDHGVVQAFPEAYQLAQKHHIKVIYGMEGYLVEQPPADEQTPSRPYHIILLAQNEVGLHNLYRLVSISHLEHFYRVPRLPRAQLAASREGLIIGTACEAGELMQALLDGADAQRLRSVASFYDYIEIQPRANNRFLIDSGRVDSMEVLEELNRKLYELGKELDMSVVATGDVHFVEPHDELHRRILQAGQGYQDVEHQAPLYLRTTDEMLEEFSYLGEEAAQEVVIENPRRIAAMVDELKPVPDGLFAPSMPGADEEIRELAYRRARELYGDPLPELIAGRLESELHSIISNGFSGIYLLAERMVKKSLSDGYLVGSRGSVGSSLVATMCGITEVNPLPPHYYCPDCQYSEFITDGSMGSGFDLPPRTCPECGLELRRDGHDIPFAVFMGFHGDKVPDIDLNFSGAYQGEMHRFVEDLLGHDNVFRAGTISTIADRTAYGFVRGYLDDQSRDVRRAEITRLIQGVSGVKRTTGQHPGGLMIVPDGHDVHEFTPVQYPANDRDSGTITTHFDYHSISSRLVKLDILGHDDPTVIRMLEDLTGVDIRDVPFDDEETLALFGGVESLSIDPNELGTTVGSLGLPEFGTRFVRQMLVDTRPSSFSELVRISGLSHGTDVWLNNAQDLVRTGTADLSHVICTRDDIMTNLIHWQMEPSVAFRIMEKVRKGRGLTPEEEEAMRTCDAPEWYIDSCKKIKYMFPKAHAVAYVMMALRIAYFKMHYPEAFYATYFSVRAGDFDVSYTGGPDELRRAMAELEQKGNDATAKEKNLVTILEVALEMTLRGVEFVPINLDRSAAEQFLIVDVASGGKGLLCPFISLQGLGAKAAHSIVEARSEQAFTSIEDLMNRTRLSRSLIELLREKGSLAHLPESDQVQLF